MQTYTLSRSFVLEHESTLETQILKSEIQIANNLANLEPILSKLGESGEFVFKIYNFNDNKYHKIREYA